MSCTPRAIFTRYLPREIFRSLILVKNSSESIPICFVYCFVEVLIIFIRHFDSTNPKLPLNSRHSAKSIFSNAAWNCVGSTDIIPRVYFAGYFIGNRFCFQHNIYWNSYQHVVYNSGILIICLHGKLCHFGLLPRGNDIQVFYQDRYTFLFSSLTDNQTCMIRNSKHDKQTVGHVKYNECVSYE